MLSSCNCSLFINDVYYIFVMHNAHVQAWNLWWYTWYWILVSGVHTSKHPVQIYERQSLLENIHQRLSAVHIGWGVLFTRRMVKVSRHDSHGTISPNQQHGNGTMVKVKGTRVPGIVEANWTDWNWSWAISPRPTTTKNMNIQHFSFPCFTPYI